MTDREALAALRNAVHDCLWADATKGLDRELADLMRAHDRATEHLGVTLHSEPLDKEHDHSKCGPIEKMGYASLHRDEWGSDLDVVSWLVWYARKVNGKSRDVAQRALEENPSLRFSERLAAVLTELRAAVEGLAADCRCEDDICGEHAEVCFDGECEDSPRWKRPVLALIDERLP